jgi:hypothetical protein
LTIDLYIISNIDMTSETRLTPMITPLPILVLPLMPAWARDNCKVANFYIMGDLYQVIQFGA